MTNHAYIRLLPWNDPAPAPERRAQQAAAARAIAYLETCQAETARNLDTAKNLESVLRGIYHEAQMCLRQDPNPPMDEVFPPEMPSFLKAAADLAAADPYLCALPVSGESPLSCRAFMVSLHALLDTLARCSARLESRQSVLIDLLAQARTVSAALTLAGSGLGYVLCRDVKRSGTPPHADWFINFDCALAPFNFQKLNSIDIENYFCSAV